MLCFVKYLFTFLFEVLLNRKRMAPFVLGFWVVRKLTPTLQVLEGKVGLTNKVHLTDCIVIGFLFWKILNLLWLR